MSEYRSEHAEFSRAGRHRAVGQPNRFWAFLCRLMAVGLNTVD